MKINQKQAAEHLGVKERTLEDYRLRGGGPPFYKIGARVVYDSAELDAWLAARRRTSTSDRGAASSPPAAA
jgi:predicted DNA-binding transcriptional regulator AlpA